MYIYREGSDYINYGTISIYLLNLSNCNYETYNFNGTIVVDSICKIPHTQLDLSHVISPGSLDRLMVRWHTWNGRTVGLESDISAIFRFSCKNNNRTISYTSSVLCYLCDT